MKKQITLLIIFTLISVGLLSGCNETDVNLPSSETEYWAILLTYTDTQGNSDNDANRNTCVKDILLNYNWQDDHIKSLVGKDATYVNLLDTIDWVKTNSDSDDKIFFVLNAHGSSNVISLADGFVYYSDLAEDLDDIEYGGFSIIILSCFGNTALPYLEKENRVIIWSQSGISNYIRALSGFADFYGNKNDWVSIEEVHNLDENYCNYWNNTALIYDDYPGELDIIKLNGYWQDLDQYNSNESIIFNSSACSIGAIKEKIDTWAAQGFVPTSPILTKVALYVNRHGYPGPLTISIKQNLSGPDLTSITIDENCFLANISVLTDFDFKDIEVVPGETYYIILKAPEAINNIGNFNYFSIVTSKSDNENDDHYLKGDLINFNNPFETHGFFNIDLEFYTFGRI